MDLRLIAVMIEIKWRLIRVCERGRRGMIEIKWQLIRVCVVGSVGDDGEGRVREREGN